MIDEDDCGAIGENWIIKLRGLKPQLGLRGIKT
jgi:hypothetical protein